MLAKKHPEVKEIAVQVKKLSFFERHRMIAEKKAMWRADLRVMMSDARESGLSAGREEGLSKGIEKGSAEREQLRMEIERLREEITRLRS